MLICDYCGKRIGEGKFITVLYVNINNRRRTRVKYEYGSHLHIKCFNKIFIYRKEDNSRNCMCGHYASFEYNGLFTEISICDLRGTFISHLNNHYYHKECFMKYWMWK